MRVCTKVWKGYSSILAFSNQFGLFARNSSQQNFEFYCYVICVASENVNTIDFDNVLFY